MHLSRTHLKLSHLISRSQVLLRCPTSTSQVSQSVSMVWFGEKCPGVWVWCRVSSLSGHQTPGGENLCGQEPGYGCDDERELYMHIWMSSSTNCSLHSLFLNCNYKECDSCRPGSHTHYITSWALSIHSSISKWLHMKTDNHSRGWHEFILENYSVRAILDNVWNTWQHHNTL